MSNDVRPDGIETHLMFLDTIRRKRGGFYSD